MGMMAMYHSDMQKSMQRNISPKAPSVFVLEPWFLTLPRPCCREQLQAVEVAHREGAMVGGSFLPYLASFQMLNGPTSAVVYTTSIRMEGEIDVL